MAFVKKTWVERAVEFAGRRLLTPVSGVADTFDVTRAEGTEFVVGDSFSAMNMNDLESRINSAILDVDANIVKKNWIINGGFDIWKRAASQTSSGYGSDDRFLNENLGSTKVHSQQSFTLGQADVPNNPTYFSRTVVTSVAGVGNYVRKSQRIEDISKLSGKTISLSFWAKADASKNIAIEFIQNFGTGGSAEVTSIGSQKLALTTTWQRFTINVAIPSVSGKTIGANNYLELLFWFDAGSDFNTRTDTLGQQSGTFDLSSVSLVEGSVAQEWQTEDCAEVLKKCQRYYYRVNAETVSSVMAGNFIATNRNSCYMIFQNLNMRIAPISIEYLNLILNLPDVGTAPVVNIVLSTMDNKTNSQITVTSSGDSLTVYRPYVLISNNTTNAYFAINAEL